MMQSYLSDKVRKQSLPVFQAAPPDAPTVKRLLLPQGELAAFYDSDTPIRYAAYIELPKGAVRGNHYHKVKLEWVYLLLGTVDLLLEDLETHQREVLPLQAGDLVMISTGVAHALRVTAPGQAIELSPARFDAADTYRHSLT